MKVKYKCNYCGDEIEVAPGEFIFSTTSCPSRNGYPCEHLPVEDNINPDHYKVGGIENWDYLVAKLTPEEIKGHCKACIIKYLARAKHKGSAQENYEKAQWYMNKLVEINND